MFVPDSVSALRLVREGSWIFLLTLLGCDNLRDFKQSLHAQSPAVPRPGLTPGQAGLEISVSPADGIAISLDGVKVATESPYRTTAFSAGGHILEVRGMGYFPVTLPVNLAVGRTTRMPVSLRPRPPKPFNAPHEPTLPPEAPKARPPARAVFTHSQVLPHKNLGDVRPAQALSLYIDTRPELPLSVDGRASGGREVVLARTRGTVVLGTIALPYQPLVGRGLEFIVPDDEAAWFVEGRQVKVRSRIHLGRTPLYVTRQIAGTEHRITLRPIL